MSFSSFLKLVEIQTKVASMIPFLLGTVYTLYRFNSFNFKNFIFMLMSLLIFDMTTTAINNYIDYKKAIKKFGFNYESHNAIVKYKIKESTVVATIFSMLIIAMIFGILLFLNTSIVVLLLGAISFAIGILYSFGPVPISRTPLGEIYSGLFMGFIIVFISIYIHIFDQGILDISYELGRLVISMNIVEILYIFLLSVPGVVGIANIMLANNICDIEDDIENKRYTLPIYIGKENALRLFASLYYISYVALLVLIILKVLPPLSALVLLTIIPVTKHLKIFFKKQTKAETFVVGVKNFVLINVAHLLMIGIASIVTLLR